MFEEGRDRESKVLVFLAILCVIFATIHVTQGIWKSGWKDYLGDELDGRFNNLILEHGYQSVIGNSSFGSPGQFAPVEGTIAYSDMHLGTLPLYAFGRTTGFSIERSFQLWAIGIGFLNALAFLLLLRAIQTPWALVGPLTILGASSASLVAFVGAHIQVFPFFAFILALRQWVLLIQDWRPERMFYALGFMGLLHLCSPYLGFFGTLAAGLIVLISGILFWDEFRINLKVDRLLSRAGSWSGLFALTMVVGAIWMYWIYFSYAARSGGREWEMIYHLAPHWKLWSFSPYPHWLYGDVFLGAPVTTLPNILCSQERFLG